jgi:hypothetical protein
MEINDVVEEVKELMKIIFEKDGLFRGDLVPYIDFITFFCHRKGWEEHITNTNSPFMKMM